MDTSIAFLGLAERAACVRDGNSDMLKWNVLGLKNFVFSALFPAPLTDAHLGLAFQRLDLTPEITINITSEDRNVDIVSLTLQAQKEQAEPEAVAFRSEGRLTMHQEQGWTVFFVPLPHGIWIPSPGSYLVSAQLENRREVIGQLTFIAVNPPRLSPEQIAAIRSDPRAAKFVRMSLACNTCSSILRTYVGLEQSKKSDDEGYIWYENLPPFFLCECGKTNIDLTYFRQNLFVLLGANEDSATDEFRFTPLYERDGLETILSSFRNLLDKDPKEERLQLFIEENPILLHQFPSIRLFYKPAILTFFKADFAVVTPQKELVLIEIERASTRLLTRGGGQAAPLRHALDQVDSWLHVIEEHRLAVLDTLRIPREEVSSVRGVVIAGRDSGYDAEHLRRLKGRERGQVSFLTYDDLGFGLSALIRRMQDL
jgi:hypothetical protein